MKDAQISLKTLSHLQRDGVRFTIAGYQRGFRWTRAEVRALLDDVREFSLAFPAESGAFYCLQPVVVTPAPDGSRIVIDGQQRLTTLYLFYCCCSWMLPPSARYNLLPFSIRYPGRPRLQECLEVLSEKEYTGAGRFAAETAEFEDDIDCHYLLEAYRCIGDWLHGLLKSPSARAGLGSLKNTFDTRVSLIWYEIPNLSAADQAALFSMLNTGKLALTDAELIRALLLERKAGQAGSPPDPADAAALQQSIASEIVLFSVCYVWIIIENCQSVVVCEPLDTGCRARAAARLPTRTGTPRKGLPSLSRRRPTRSVFRFMYFPSG